MPNWTINNLTIQGQSGDLATIKGYFENAHPFQSILPCPQELKDTHSYHPPSEKQLENKAKYGYESWYDWRIENWGTKGDIQEGEVTIEAGVDGELRIEFETPWSPPLALLLHVSNRYPSCLFRLLFRQEEEMYEYVYLRVIQNGEVIKRTRTCNITLMMRIRNIASDLRWRIRHYLKSR